jgi:predicted protein tyrosine phosphatase
MTLIVCSLNDMPAVVLRRRPSHLLTLIDPSTPVERPPDVHESRHLRIDVDDINQPIEGYRAPDEACVRRFLEFARSWDASAPMVVHCYAGISRPAASAFVIACDRNPEIGEHRIALALRRAASHVLPNRRIVALADDILVRRGRMVDAIEAIGGPEPTAISAPFDLPARY